MRLCVNIDHIATLRNSRGGSEPDPVVAAQICEQSGADGIVVHLREDRRHIKDHDVWKLREILETKLDLEMGASEEIVTIALKVLPNLVTLVPEKRQELTTEGGLDVITHKERLKNVIQQFHSKNIPVSLFIDPVLIQIETSKEIGADMIEIHTGEYAEAKTPEDIQRYLKTIKHAASAGKKLNLGVNAGHGLNYINVSAVSAIPEIDELSIGHSIISHAAFVGLGQAVKEMLSLVK
ncbi:MAG: pyridoxine 5'-phosphate synthase [Bacteriovoracaceae bacterium]|nr:pyridoxine 5'-phosphate synthase [Bacteroidota bacterium]